MSFVPPTRASGFRAPAVKAAQTGENLGPKGDSLSLGTQGGFLTLFKTHFRMTLSYCFYLYFILSPRLLPSNVLTAFA
jgi:hypothetical protein